tara:strand:+ start:5201 stop:5935 length:735 start_codon:yes stop_codon:yes gene_type:complete
MLLMGILACTPPAGAHIDLSILENLKIKVESEYDDVYTEELDPYASRGLKQAYISSVVVRIYKDGIPMGLGSGNYFKMRKKRFIITAAHVVDTPDQAIMIMEKGGIETEAKVAYMDIDSDIAVLVPIKRLKYTKAIPFRRDITNQMGEKIYHCGHPAREGWHISEGLLTGVHSDTLLVNSFVWPGSSGSVIFDEGGRVVGVVSAIRVDMIAGVFPQFIEHIVLASNIKMLDQSTLKAALENVGE